MQKKFIKKDRKSFFTPLQIAYPLALESEGDREVREPLSTVQTFQVYLVFREVQPLKIQVKFKDFFSVNVFTQQPVVISFNFGTKNMNTCDNLTT